MPEKYTPGYSSNATNFMANRSSHATPRNAGNLRKGVAPRCSDCRRAK